MRSTKFGLSRLAFDEKQPYCCTGSDERRIDQELSTGSDNIYDELQKLTSHYVTHAEVLYFTILRSFNPFFYCSTINRVRGAIR